MNLENLLSSGMQNIDLIEEMHDRYLNDPQSVDPQWREFFRQAESMPQASEKEPVAKVFEAPPDLKVYNLIQAYRTYGHLMAKINPIAVMEVDLPWQLRLENLGFSKEELDAEFPTCGLMEQETAPLQKIVDLLQEIYCNKIGVEYMGLQNPQLEEWLQNKIEPKRFKIDLTIDQKKMILQHLNKSELFESFLHTKFTGQKRFSLEGGETLIPILASILNHGAELGLEEMVVGMAHRGRLNVLSNIMEKSYEDIFSEFEEGYIPLSFEGSGDVKYHKGFSSVISAVNGKKIEVVLCPNPSHLEAVDPVVQGRTHALQIKKNDEVERDRVLPVLIHGDAAIAGQGVVYETMQMYRLKGYTTGGTVHIVINNQIGFTTLPQEGRSTLYCTDIARTFCAPVFHVNAEDPEACIMATNLALEIRNRFDCDVFIDLNCYRKYGHNEGDEPAFTQPLEYQMIRKKKPIREIYRDDLIQQGVLERQMAESLEVEFKASLQEALTSVQLPKNKTAASAPVKKEKNMFPVVETAVDQKSLLQIGQKMNEVPDGLVVHRKLQNLIKDRLAMAKGEKPIDWGMGEMLAYATLLAEGTHVRLAGQDCCRGTFSHRHALWMDQKVERAYFSLKHLQDEQGRFDVINSPLTEYAGFGFEYGYSLGYPEALVIWEAQFGDFCNGAQVIIDQFLSTAEQKWGQKSTVVMLLPHGYEGQGPEHSSARMERFLALCGNDNMQIVSASTPGQLFHLLRRQIKSPNKLPLVVFTPKGLLRHPKCVSSVEDLSTGGFEEILDDPSPAKKTKKLVFCCGRIYYDLLVEREERGAEEMTIVRLEQLYPLKVESVKEILKKYEGFEKCIWVQDEPKNMGAWDYIRPLLRELLPANIEPTGVGRPRSASPAAGSYALHQKEHADLMKELFS